MKNSMVMNNDVNYVTIEQSTRAYASIAFMSFVSLNMIILYDYGVDTSLIIGFDNFIAELWDRVINLNFF